VNLAWGVSNDTNFRGYRVYRSTDGVTWGALGTTSSASYSDTHKKNLDSVRYYVVGYDKAGNESNATNLVTLSKNQCS
jgi:fibronectin type 3 domain-containing protein